MPTAILSSPSVMPSDALFAGDSSLCVAVAGWTMPVKRSPTLVARVQTSRAFRNRYEASRLSSLSLTVTIAP